MKTFSGLFHDFNNPPHCIFFKLLMSNYFIDFSPFLLDLLLLIHLLFINVVSIPDYTVSNGRIISK